MGLKTMLAMAAAAVGGIYLTSDEGKKAREALREKKSVFQPIIENLTTQANAILEGTEKFNSEAVKTNVEKLIEEAKKILLDINLDKTTDSIKKAIKIANKKIRDAANEPATLKKTSVKRKPITKTKTVKLIKKTDTKTKPIKLKK